MKGQDNHHEQGGTLVGEVREAVGAGGCRARSQDFSQCQLRSLLHGHKSTAASEQPTPLPYFAKPAPRKEVLFSRCAWAQRWALPPDILLLTVALWGFHSFPTTSAFPLLGPRGVSTTVALTTGSGHHGGLHPAPGGDTEQGCLSGRRAGHTG